MKLYYCHSCNEIYIDTPDCDCAVETGWLEKNRVAHKPGGGLQK